MAFPKRVKKQGVRKAPRGAREMCVRVPVGSANRSWKRNHPYQERAPKWLDGYLLSGSKFFPTVNRGMKKAADEFATGVRSVRPHRPDKAWGSGTSYPPSAERRISPLQHLAAYWHTHSENTIERRVLGLDHVTAWERERKGEELRRPSTERMPYLAEESYARKGVGWSCPIKELGKGGGGGSKVRIRWIIHFQFLTSKWGKVNVAYILNFRSSAATAGNSICLFSKIVNGMRKNPNFS